LEVIVENIQEIMNQPLNHIRNSSQRKSPETHKRKALKKQPLKKKRTHRKKPKKTKKTKPKKTKKTKKSRKTKHISKIGRLGKM